MGMSLNSQDLAFRNEVRAFLAEALTPEIKAASMRQAGVFSDGGLSKKWQRILFEKGWVAPSWPKEYGGTGWTPVQRLIFADECARADAPTLPAMALQMCGPMLIGYGTPEQKAFFLPRMLSGEHYWCQGYSEPQAGSDLASLRTRAVRQGDDYVVNGSKIWTTHAHHANWIFLLVRTSTEGKPQAGISFLLSPLDVPGISIKPIISMSGEHELNQVFFDEVRIPVANRVGEENEGWTVAKYLLEFERGGGCAASRLKVLLGRARGIAEVESGYSGGILWNEGAYRRKWSMLEIDLDVLDHAERRVAAILTSGGRVGDFAASTLKLTIGHLQQRVAELAMDTLGYYAAPDQRGALGSSATMDPIGPRYAATPMAKYLNSRATTIYGGSQEIQRNIIARLLLGA
jgi:acyl-CoA dehydrogenase